MRGRHERPEIGLRIERIPRRICVAAPLDEACNEVLGDGSVNEQARTGIAHLTHIAVDAVDRVAHRAVEILEVREENLRGLAAAFERDALHIGAAGIDQHQLADFG